jgi:hypothetical protein
MAELLKWVVDEIEKRLEGRNLGGVKMPPRGRLLAA